MCNLGDIILVSNYKSNGNTLGRHSFIVISDEPDKIKGLDYDIICNAMSSFKSEEQKIKKLKYDGNFPIYNKDTIIENGNDKDGFAKSEQFYYFNKDKIKYSVIGHVNPSTFNLLISYIEDLEIAIEHITDNL